MPWTPQEQSSLPSYNQNEGSEQYPPIFLQGREVFNGINILMNEENLSFIYALMFKTSVTRDRIAEQFYEATLESGRSTFKSLFHLGCITLDKVVNLSKCFFIIAIIIPTSLDC